MTRDDYVDLVERRYFGNVTQADIPAVVACFTDDALVTIYHGDAAPRLFKAQPSAARLPCPASSSICSPTTTQNSPNSSITWTQGASAAPRPSSSR